MPGKKKEKLKTKNIPPTNELEEAKKKRFEMLCGIIIAFFAAVLAVTDLGAGKYGDDELIAHNEKSNAYQWYQSKSIKQNLVEGERDMLKTLLAAGAIHKNQIPGMKSLVINLDQKIEKYDKEKKEILLGSSAVNKNNWVQEVDGKMGAVIGAKQWEQNTDLLGKAGDFFDYATLFLQLCIVFGAISIVLQIDKFKWVFFASMSVLGFIGTTISIIAFVKAFAIPALG
jgi:hypothetical protein